MELIINLKHDTLAYCKEQKDGTLKDNNLFGFEEFYIIEHDTHHEIDFVNDAGKMYSYECKFTDHGGRLVVTI